MVSKDLLEQLLRSDINKKVFVIKYPYKADPISIISSLSDIIPKPFDVYRILNRHIPPDQGSEIVRNLRSGKNLVLIPETDRFAYDLAYAWYEFCRDPKSHISITGTLHLNPSREIETLGQLLLLHPDNRDLGRLNETFVFRLNPEDMSELSLSQSVISIIPIGIEHLIGNNNLTIRDLCFLHLRDEKPVPKNQIPKIFNSGLPLTWSGLQSFLKQGESIRPILDSWFESGEIDHEKWLVGHDFLDFLRDYENTEKDSGIWNSIYDVVWYLSFLDNQKKVFRGQFDASWPLISTLYRPDSTTGILDIQTLHERVAMTTQFTDQLRARHSEFFASEPTEEELLAVAQHYGFSTPFLDYSYSLKIAALFATQKATNMQKGEDHVGAIYYMYPDRIEIGGSKESGMKENFSFSDFNLIEKSGIQVGNIHLIEPNLKDLENRIARQQGLFLAESETRSLKSVAIDRILFRQHPGMVFEDPSISVELTHIFPADSTLQTLADEIKHRFDKPRISSVLGQSKIPTASIIGSTSENLFSLLRNTSDFFEALKGTFQENFKNFSKEELAEILNEYFVLCQMRANADTTLKKLNPLKDALLRVAGKLEVDSKWLIKTVEEKLGVLDHPSWEGNLPNPSTQNEASALSLGLFLATWEKLQHIRGNEAANLTLSATLLLQEF